MPLRNKAEQSGPVTPFERNCYIFLLTVFVALIGAEIIKDFHPVKLTILFFVLFWGPMMALHEAGHALMAALLNWQIRLVVIGMNRDLWRFHIAGRQVVIKLLPLGGCVFSAPRNLSWPRLKMALIYLAGPGIELLLLALLVGFLGSDVFLTRSEDIGIIALQSLAITILYGAITNLIPMPVDVNGRWIANDGLGFLRSFRMKRQDFVAMMEAAPEVEPEEEWWERGDEGWATDRDPDRWR